MNTKLYKQNGGHTIGENTLQDQFLTELVKQKAIRPSIRSFCFHNDKILVQRPSDNPTACYAFIGGILEIGEKMEERIRKGYIEETNAEVISAEYLFVVENIFDYKDGIFHSLEHYFFVDINSYDISSCDPELLQFWLPLNELQKYDLRPHVLRDALIDGSWKNKKHFINDTRNTDRNA